MLRAADHDDARTMLLSSQVLRLARMAAGPRLRVSAGFRPASPGCARSLPDGAVVAGANTATRRAGLLASGLAGRVVDTFTLARESYVCQHN